MPSSWRNFWGGVLRLQWDKSAPWMGFRNALGVAAPIATGAALGSLPFGVSAGIGALNVSFIDSGIPYGQRAKRMLAASAVVSFAVFAGAASGSHHNLTLIAGALWAFAAGMLVALDQTAADLGTSSLVTLLVFAALPMSPAQAATAGLLAFAGGVLQTALSVARWPIRPYAPERRALSDLFRALAGAIASSAHASQPPPVTAQSTHAQEILAALDRDRSIEAERLRALLSQAERMRLALLTLSRLRVRIEREDRNSGALAALDRFLDLAAAALRDLADERPAQPALETRDLVDALRTVPGPTVRDARRQMDALAGQLRAAADLVARTIPAGAAQFARREASQSWRLRLKGTFATLRANLSLQSAACRHAVRLAVCVAVGQALAHAFHIARPAWAPMTIAIVLKPDFGSTFSRGVLRLAGTFAGLAIATGLFHAVSTTAVGPEIALLAVFMFVTRAYGMVNYGIAATAITALVVLLLALSGVAPNTVIVPRAINTVLGGAVALIAYAVWPTWERTQLGETIARMLDAYREYFHQIRRAYEQPETPRPAALDRVRLDARRARTNLEASVERLASEPGTPPDRMRILGGLLANSHRLAHAMMALEAGLAASSPAPARPEFHAFAGEVEITLGKLAGALRGARLIASALPDLRERHDALLKSGESEIARYALVNVESDRVTNAVNTLAGDVLAWTSQPSVRR